MAIGTSTLVEIFDKWAETYDSSIAIAEWGFEQYYDGIIWLCSQLLNKSQHTRVIDLGCGTGVLAEMLQRTTPSINYVGIDFSNKMLNIAKRKSPKSVFVKTDYRHFDRWKIYLNNEYNCVVVSSYSLHHISDKEKIDLINNIFTASKKHAFYFYIVDFAFLDNFERNLLLEEQIKLGKYHIKKEIETEYYADLSTIKNTLSKSNLDFSFERNGMWDWRITVQRR